jgi:predicted alpha/beta superfamily hydrolase
LKNFVLYFVLFFICVSATAQPAKYSTASKNVSIIDTAFYMPQLNRYRRIWIYLPYNYNSTKQQYPVVYLQDGQNIFDKATSFIDEWGVDECVDTLIQKGTKASIIVAIDNGGEQRMNEYNPYVHEKYGGGEGDKYVDFLTNTLKPYIDKNYRTLKDAANTTIAGSSMGALISYYAALTQITQ